jgi:hypothetical protein
MICLIEFRLNFNYKSSMLAIAVLLLATTALCGYRAPPYAEWAHSHVVWINRNLQHDTELYQMVSTYQQRNHSTTKMEYPSEESTSTPRGPSVLTTSSSIKKSFRTLKTLLLISITRILRS